MRRRRRASGSVRASRSARIAKVLRELAATKRALAAAEARVADEVPFQKLVEHASDTLSIVGADGRLLYVSPAWERITGHPIEASRDLLFALHPDDVPRVQGALRGLVAAGPGATARVEYRRRHADGRWIRLEA